jgi:protein-S-isoprenylcysteine O-methyltransferase Ste14
MKQRNTKTIDISGKRFITGMIIHQIILFLILFVSAGTIHIMRFWIFFIINLSYSGIEMAFLVKKNPQLINGRGKPINPDTATWDRYMVRLFIMFFYIIIIACSLDFGRFKWSTLNSIYLIPGYLIFFTGKAIITWSQIVNKHFERTVRIQADRNHSVVSDGPYKYIRHPGYLGIIIFVLGIPLLLGSAYGLIASFFCIGVLIIRTYLEDHFLRKELAGYDEYSRTVKYRLCPGIF